MNATLSFAQLDTAPVTDYTREHLMCAREYVLFVKRTARMGGFGEIAGRMIRATVGYKFDSAPLADVLAYMSDEGFLTRYAINLELWYAGLNKSATENTLKSNAAKHSAAAALTSDVVAFTRLVKALKILCQRNQEWRENGNHLSLPYNGHKAILDLFGINVTNARRLSLATA
jgi:hypothetical protein